MSFFTRHWPRLLLWTNALGVAAFYLILWKRTRPANEDYVDIAPVLEDPDISSPSINLPLVSIIVPARNEERNIRRCVQSLLAQDYANVEIIVVNDGSTDGTIHVLDELVHTDPNASRLRIISLQDELPAGWAGKPHAIHCGVQQARGEWLLFTDADTWHAPNALRSVVMQAQAEDLALFTLSTTQELPTFWERVMMPIAFMGVSMLYPPRAVNDPATSVAIANGQYLLMRRSVYDQLGGYARPELRGTLVDDRDMAQVVKDHGYRLRFVEGNDLVSVRMYQSFGEIWRGWRKNSFLGNRGGLPFLLLQLIGLPMVTIMPFLLPFYGKLLSLITHRSVSTCESTLAASLALVPLLSYRRWINQYMRVPSAYALTHPLGGALFVGILGESAWRIVTRKGVDWRGRQYHAEKTL